MATQTRTDKHLVLAVQTTPLTIHDDLAEAYAEMLTLYGEGWDDETDIRQRS
jgi:hypothetical protein